MPSTVLQSIMPLNVDSTMISCARSCLQKFRLEFVLGLRPIGLSVDLHAGACFALAIEETYRQIHIAKRPLAEALLRAHFAFMASWGDFEIPEWKRTAKTKERVWEAVEGYFAEWSPLTDPCQPYTAADGNPTFEYTFAIPLEPFCDPHAGTVKPGDFPEHPDGGPFLYSGRFDMLGSYMGYPCIRDEKTTGSSIGDRWAEQWDLRSQFMGYVWACRQGGVDARNVIVRGIGIQKTQLRFVEAIKTYSDFLIARWYEQLRRDLWRIRRAWDEGYFDFNLGESCTAYGSCAFMTNCQSQVPEAWMQGYEVRRWNPLIKNPVKVPTS